MKKILGIIVIVLVIVGVVLVNKKQHKDLPLVNDVNQTQELESLQGLIIRVDTPQDGDTIISPLKITGEAPGFWFFEATAPVFLTNWDGLIIADGYIQAKGDWMTEDYVEFEGTIEFEKPEYGERGTLILNRQNASGLPENEDAVELTIYFE